MDPAPRYRVVQVARAQLPLTEVIDTLQGTKGSWVLSGLQVTQSQMMPGGITLREVFRIVTVEAAYRR